MTEDLERIRRGAKAEKAGSAFEISILKSAGVYAELGIADVRQLPVPTAPARGPAMNLAIKVGGQKMAGLLRMRMKRQGYDFYGFMGPNAGPDADPGAWHGLGIAMEAKSNAEPKPSLPIVTEGGGVSVHQLDALADAAEEWGVVATIVWRAGDQRLVLMPDEVIRAREMFHAGERKSIPRHRFTEFERVEYPGTMIEDWLFPLRLWLERRGRPSASVSKRKAYPMIQYEMNLTESIIDASGGGGDESLVIRGCKVMDRHTIDQLARTAKDARDFIDQVKRLGCANE